MKMTNDRQEKFIEWYQRSLRDHLVTFNDGVTAIIITIMVLSLPAPKTDADLKKFLFDAINYLSCLLYTSDAADDDGYV